MRKSSCPLARMWHTDLYEETGFRITLINSTHMHFGKRLITGVLKSYPNQPLIAKKGAHDLAQSSNQLS